MNIQIGAKLKSLRFAHSMTQDQLAQKLGVSAQAISKWENNTNMPDIQLLPDLAVIFGITIDELFTITEENHMDRIENQLENVSFLTDEEFRQDEQFLKGCQESPRYVARATLLLAELYNKRAEEFRRLAKPVARRALLLNPTVKDAHNAIFDAENGPYQDWDLNNYGELITFYKEFVRNHAEDPRGYFWLLGLLIHDHRLEEARAYTEKMRQVADSYHYEMYMGRICREDCDLEGALCWWKRMTEHDPDNWIVWAEYADELARLGRYEEAAAYYEKAMPMRPRPRFIDCEEAVSLICMMKGDVARALEMKRQSLRIVLEDWTTEGESVHRIQREILRLEGLLQKKKQ